MKIYLLRVRAHSIALPASAAQTEPTSLAPVSGVRGWLLRWFKKLQDSLERSESGIGPHVKRAWNWLHTWLAPDEPLLMQLRSAQAFEVAHPTEQSREQASKVWHHYLAGRWSTHFGWFLVNVVISPVTVVLAPLPGPNVIGYWFLYRAVCHLLILLGIRQAWRNRGHTTFLACVPLDSMPGENHLSRLLRIGQELGVPGIEAYRDWWKPRLAHPERDAPSASLETMADSARDSETSPTQPQKTGNPSARFHAPTWIPNALSASRIVLGLGFPWFPTWSRPYVIVGGAVTDVLDGAYCRVFRVSSVAGQILDPVADKLFVFAVLIVLLIERRISLGAAFLVGFRDIAVVIGSLTVVIMKGWHAAKHLPPTIVGKVATALQFALLLVLVCYPSAAAILIPPTAVASVLAGIDYVRREH
ncbi:MAG TPA: CDP-alcohol phosphatidyltransferase family protein [Isosphaeraceae bacterium]|nr:CDP-alcohol phosphatidyltransferase family protein [Isosphaeraceae bacterium]